MTADSKSQNDLHALLSERTASLNEAEHRVRVLQARVIELENLLPTPLERDTMRKVAKYADMVDAKLAKDGL